MDSGLIDTHICRYILVWYLGLLSYSPWLVATLEHFCPLVVVVQVKRGCGHCKTVIWGLRSISFMFCSWTREISDTWNKLFEMLGNSTPLGRCGKPVVSLGQQHTWSAHPILDCGERGLALADRISLSSLAHGKMGGRHMGLGVTRTPTTARLWLREYSWGYWADPYSPDTECV